MGGVEMEENSEIEEGEAFQYKDDDDDKNIDPEIALSYIDEKIQNVLGHFQKDFDGGVSAENLGAKFDWYGSFLPTYGRSPQRNCSWSHPKTLQTNTVASRSPNNLPVEGPSQSLKVSSNILPSVKLGTASYSANALQKSGMASGDVLIKQGCNISSASVSRKSNAKDKTSNESGNLSDQRTLKVRLKVGPDSVARKNAAIYSGLGLDNSPSSSLGNSLEESDGLLPLSEQIADESPVSILQIMTSYPIPGGILVSPLHDSLLWLMRKDKFPGNGKTVPPFKCIQDNFASLADESVSSMGIGKLSKGKAKKFSRNSEKADHGNGVFENCTSFSAKRKMDSDATENKGMLSNNLKSMPLLGTNGGETLKTTGGPSEVPREVDHDGLRGGLFSSDMMPEDSLESRSGQYCGKSEKRNGRSGSVEKVSEHRALTCDDASGNLKGNGKSKNSKIYAPSKGCSDTSKYKEDLKVGSQAPSKQKIGQQASFHVQDEMSMPHVKEKQLSEGNKSNSKERSKKAAGLLTKESSGIGISEATKTTHGISKSKNKVNKMKLQKDINKFRDDPRDPLDSKFGKDSPMNFLERPSSYRQKGSTFDNLEMEQNASFDKSRERFSGKRVGDESIAGALMKDVPHAVTSISGNLASEVVPPAMGPILIEEHWVCCDSCQKWRLLPYGTKPEQLPEKWLCRMLNWLPGMNRCDISEEETTKALNALYQLPLAVGQNNLQSLGNVTVSGVHIQHVDLKQQIVDSHAASSQGKKKRGLKEITKAGGNSGVVESSISIKKNLQDSVESRSLNDMNQSPAKANLSNKTTFDTLSKSHNLSAEQKENHIAGGDTKQVKMKNKREADHYGYGTLKKTKTEDAIHADKHLNYDMDLERMGLNSKSDLSTKAGGKNLLKSNEDSTLGEVKCDRKGSLLVSAKKLGDHAQIPSDGVSLDMKAGDKKNISVKKRKLKEWQDNQNGLDSNLNAEEISASELKKEKKSRVVKRGASSINNSNDKLDKKQAIAQIFLSADQDQPIDGLEAVSYQKPRKHRRKLSQQTLHGVDSLRKDLGPGQLSMTATSSSSKVSGSLKTRATYDDVKASPVESVSSSPLRTSFSEKLGSTRGNILGKDDATHGGIPMIDEQRRCRDKESNDQINKSGTVKEEKVSGGFHPEPFKVFPLDYRDGDANHRIGQTKCSDFPNGGAEVRENPECTGEPLATENCHDEDRAEQKQCENVPFPHKFGKVSSFRLKDNDRSSTSDFDIDEMKFSESVNGHGDFSKESIRYGSEIDPRSHSPLRKRMNNVKHSILDKPGSKSSKGEKVKDSYIRQCSNDSRMDNPLKLPECDHSDAQLSALCSTNWNAAVPENMIKDFDSQTKGRPMQKESRSRTPKLAAHTEWEAKHDSQNHQSASGSLQEGAPVGLRVHASSNGDVSKALRYPGNSETKNGAHQNFGHRVPDIRGTRDFNTPSPGRTNSSSQTATNALKEAKVLRDYADQLKASGFGFESNETNFQAALKFLQGASLLETCNETGRGEEMAQMQVYSTAAKLCGCCALEYEKRHEMAAAALAYKCMEVAYWRVVYCKNSSLSRERNELQACLQTFSQGESPSSSASDIDNLNNQATVDKAAISKGTVSHIAGNPVIVARNHSNFLRLLDFTRDVNFAVEASRKSENAYSSANNIALEEARNRDCIISVKKVIDFSFQDVEELMRLVKHAMEAITHAGLVGARE